MKSLLIVCFLALFVIDLNGQIIPEIAKKQIEADSLKSKLERINKELMDLKLKKIREDLLSIGYPVSPFHGQLISHSAMTLEYAEDYEQAAWVYHIISPDIVSGNESRSNDFRPDTLVATGSAVEQDYFLVKVNDEGDSVYDGFGFDRGHLAPSADFRWNPKALSESFYYSNMSPQTSQFNRGIWSEIEANLRGYVYRSGHPLYVVTGGILKKDLPVITRGINKVSIPELFYKVAIDPLTGDGIAFVVPNGKDFKKPENYCLTIDSVETLTGIDFFPKFADSLQAESQFDTYKWIPLAGKNDVAPIDPTTLPRNTFNSEQALLYMDKGEAIKVCGTVVGTHYSKKGNVFLNFDKAYPNQIFTVFIKAADLVNFSYKPQEELKGQCICITGKINNFQKVPTMDVNREERIMFYKPD